MPNASESGSRWLLKLNSGDRVMLYQPKIMPEDELTFVHSILAKHEIKKAFYTKISVSSDGKILDYHLVAMELNPEFSPEVFFEDLSSNVNKLSGFKFLYLNNNVELSAQIRRCKNIYEA